tara:strand:+ start:53 stop:361 length:309 start_codon:yes stop_codon:yes gene_type:complete
MIIVKTSSDNFDVLEKICNQVIGKKLAACANIIPNCFSYFYWEGKIQKNQEYLVFIKTLKINEKKIYKIIKKYHNYDIPEILTLKLENIEKDYMKWASGEIN